MCYNRNIFLGTEDKVMEKSKVYFTDFRTRLGEGLPSKLKRLMKAAGIQDMDMDHKFVAIKMHFGELGNLGFLRPNYAKAVADVVKELGGIPFLTDCNTLYPGSRKNAIEHMYCAWENGFTPLTVGCPVIIGDGLKGTDDIEVPLLVPLFISAFRRANDLAMAMEARCYRGGEGRTKMKPLIYHKRDYIAYGCIAAYMVISIVVGRLPFLP